MRQKLRPFGLLVAGPVVLLAGVLAPPVASADPVVATTTSLASSLNPSTAGQDVTLTATVIPDTTGGAPVSGTVSFLDAGTEFGTGTVSGGVASLTTAALAAGTHSLTAVYAGDAEHAGSSSTSLDQVVAAPPPVTPPAPVAPPTKPVKKPVVRLFASATKASVGDKVTLSWRTKRADEVMASGDWKGAQKTSGKVSVRLTDRGKHVYRLTVVNASGKARATVTILASRKAKDLALTVTDELVLGGSVVDVAADGLAQAEPYTVRLAGKVLLSGKADKKGDVHREVRLAEDSPEGALALTITGSNPGRVGTATLNVIRPVKELAVKVKKDEVAPKKVQMVTVSGLAAGEEVTIRYAGEVIDTRTAPEDGKLSYSFKVGDDAGEQTVTVTGQAPGRTGQATFTVSDNEGAGGGEALRHL